MTSVETTTLVLARKRPEALMQFFEVSGKEIPHAWTAKDRFGTVIAAVGRDRSEAARLAHAQIDASAAKAKGARERA